MEKENKEKKQEKINIIFNIMKKKGWKIDSYNPKMIGDTSYEFFGKASDVIIQLEELKDYQKEFMTQMSFKQYLKLSENEKEETDISYFYYESFTELIKDIKQKVSKKILRKCDILCIQKSDIDNCYFLADYDDCLEDIVELYIQA